MPDVDIPCRPDYDTVSQLYYFPAFCLSSIVQLVLKEWCGGTTRVTVTVNVIIIVHYRDSEHCHHSHNLYSTLWIFEESIHTIHKVCVVLKIIQALLFFAVVEEGNGGAFASAVRWSAADMKCVWPRRVP